ncbi:Sulfofructose kinase [bioreactor metagenome]|uniref:Sulfofructose kinase n=1 Tax=bioreactor metagenome TaxID=1076179 RepID=A0A644Z1V4_9ZZZZ
MKKLTSVQIRQMWLDFFKSKGHKVEPGASLIPHNDPTLLWINSGVAALKKYFDGSEMKIVPSYNVEVVDTTGAGDTFCGGLAAALVRGDNLEDAIKFANKAAAISITKLGAQSGMPTLEEFNNFKFK